jgi:hypothetical protein
MSMVARVLSGLDTRYRSGAVDVERTSRIEFKAGRRLPDGQIGPGSERRLHHLLAADAFTLLLFDDRAETPATSSLGEGLDDVLVMRRVGAPSRPRHRPDWALIRPDGYVATSGALTELAKAGRYLEQWLGGQFAAARSTL